MVSQMFAWIRMSSFNHDDLFCSHFSFNVIRNHAKCEVSSHLLQVPKVSQTYPKHRSQHELSDIKPRWRHDCTQPDVTPCRPKEHLAVAPLLGHTLSNSRLACSRLASGSTASGTARRFVVPAASSPTLSISVVVGALQVGGRRSTVWRQH